MPGRRPLGNPSGLLAGVLFLLVLGLLLAGCTVSERYDDRGRLIDRTVRPGVALPPPPDRRPMALRRRGIGLAAGYGQLTLGYFDIIIGGIAGDRCAIPLRPQSGD